MKDYRDYLNKFINENLKDTYYDSFRENMITAFNEGFSAGAAWMMDMQNKNRSNEDS